MAGDNRIHMPGAFGGLMRYDSEYKSKFLVTPAQVIGFVVAIVLFVFILKLFLKIPA